MKFRVGEESQNPIISDFIFSFSKENLFKLCIFLIILFGGILRFTNLNWDDGYYYHPDERNIAAGVSRIEFPYKLDPEFHAYNGFSIYLIRSVGEVMTALTGEINWHKDWAAINWIGRNISALCSTFAIFLFFVLMKYFIKERRYLLLGTFLFATTVGFIQYAHYGVTESMLTLQLLLITIQSIRLMKNYKTGDNWFYLAIICAISIATKTSALSMMLIPALTILYIFVNAEDKVKVIKFSFFFAFIIITTAFIFTPFSVVNYKKFEESMIYEGGVVDGSTPVPYTVQFNNTPKYLFQLFNLLWQAGPVVGIFGFISTIILFIKTSFQRKSNVYIYAFVVFGLVYFLYVGRWHTKFIRYMIPLIPVLILSTVWLIRSLNKFTLTKAAGYALIFISVISGLLYSVAYTRTFVDPNTRIEASKWVYKNIPANSTILHEHWDDRIPTGMRNQPDEFKYIELTNYDDDNVGKVMKLAERLSKGDYITISSRRLIGSIGKDKMKYPFTSNYYKLLFEEKLGYKKIEEFSSYANIMGVTFKDDVFEETVQVYDRPTVYIFKNQYKKSASELFNLIYNVRR